MLVITRMYPHAWGLGINASEELKGLNPKNRFYDSAISNGVWANVSVDTIMHPDVHSFYGNESSGILGQGLAFDGIAVSVLYSRFSSMLLSRELGNLLFIID